MCKRLCDIDFQTAFKVGEIKSDSHRRCVHFYACICAFASDEALAKEFKYYIDLDKILGKDIKVVPVMVILEIHVARMLVVVNGNFIIFHSKCEPDVKDMCRKITSNMFL